MAERSPGKDSISGHWELMGCPLGEPFPLFPNGFPDEVIEAFERRTGLGILGNKPASGTEIIEELGEQHLRTGLPIVYTSADSVFQVAAHEGVIDRLELYRICTHARAVLAGRYRVARVIARPFRGEPGSFVRTEGRRDFAAPPPEETLLDLLSGSGRRVVTIGKIHDLFSCRGIDEIVPAAGNEETMRLAADFIAGGGAFSFLFINLIDFDMLWGHRRDIEHYASGLERFDEWFGGFIRLLGHGVLLAVTSDHGCDPTAPGSDHTREYVPILALLTGQRRGVPLGTRSTFSDLAATVAGFFGIRTAHGESFLELVG
jgi:phosphopentomutase